MGWPQLVKPRPHYIVAMPMGRVWGENGAVISPDNKLIWDASHEIMTKPHEHSLFSQQKLPPVTFIPENLAVLTHMEGYSYYFWMFDVLARIELLRRNDIQIDRYVFTSMTRAFQEETLLRLGVTCEKQIICDNHTHIQGLELIVTPLVADTGMTPKWVCEFLREEFLEKPGIKPSRDFKRIYVSRGDAKRRQVKNEQDVMDYLKRYGFDCVLLDGLSVAEQAQIFFSAEVVIAPHGAALTNLVFSKPGTKVIELFSPLWLRHTYCIISQHFDLDYSRLIGIGHGSSVILSSPLSDIQIALEADITVNIGQLAKQLRAAGVH
ncbi:glycosyltransferase family 61 protein [Brevibacillus choshinensis]|uniref:glycosyltransferase family 61 protein n=1 Tax=Brevibacillus choshinensis TaxID=54911 RepID=UPI00137B24B0|nr:glycosyltransferase family 61 protein [Brevibacillus choshinensis]